MITNASEFIRDLHKVLRGVAKRADEDVTKTIKTVSYKLKQSHSVHYELSRWRSLDARRHEFTFKHNQDGTYTYIYSR